MARRSFNIFVPALHDIYLEALAASGEYVVAADAVNCRPGEIKKYRDQNPEFAEQCSEAIARFVAGLHGAAVVRARDGFEVPIIGGRNRDQIVAHERRYSDTLLSHLLKAHDPSRFGNKQEVTVNGSLDVSTHFDYSALSRRAREKLRELLQIIKEDQDELIA